MVAERLWKTVLLLETDSSDRDVRMLAETGRDVKIVAVGCQDGGSGILGCGQRLREMSRDDVKIVVEGCQDGGRGVLGRWQRLGEMSRLWQRDVWMLWQRDVRVLAETEKNVKMVAEGCQDVGRD